MASPPPRVTAVAGAAAVAALGLASAVRTARRRLLGIPVGSGGPGSQRLPLAVTVLADEQTLDAHPAVDGLRALEGLDVELRPAPGERGTEVRLRPQEGRTWSGLDPATARRTLREAKSLVEAGLVVSPTEPGSSRPTLLNHPLRQATADGRAGGRL